MTKPRAAPDHLPELCFGQHPLEKHQVDEFRNVDARVEHIHRHGDLEVGRANFGKLLDEFGGPVHQVVDTLAEQAAMFGKQDVEALDDQLGVVAVAGEDDRLADAIAAFHALAFFHQPQQHLVDGVVVEQPLVQFLGVDARRYVAVGVGEGFLVFFLLLGAQFVVADALTREFQRHRHAPVRHQVLVGHALIQAVVVGRVLVGQPEKGVGIVVGVFLGRGRQPQQQAVEVSEQGAVFFVNRAVGFVHDHQVEVAGAEGADAPDRRRVDDVAHRAVGREHQPLAAVSFGFQQVEARQATQYLLEAVVGLFYQRHAVGQEEYPPRPALVDQHIHQGGGGAGFARPGGHHQQRLAVAAPPVIGQALHGHFLVVAVGDGRADVVAAEVLPPAGRTLTDEPA